MITQKINDIKVKKLPTQQIDHSQIKGFDLIPELYANIFICAHKKSGKTTVLFNIIKNCASKDTKIVFFVSTFYKDDSYKEIRKYLEKKNIEFDSYTEIKEDKIDHLKTLIDELQADYVEDEKSDSEKEEKYKPLILHFGEDDKEITFKIRKYKPKKIAPQIIIVFDDMSAEIRNNPSIKKLLKQNRHYKIKVIISSQYVNDLLPESRSQIDVWLLFAGHNIEKLKEIYNASDPIIPFEKFVELYEDATKEKHNFFYIDKNNCQYRKNFSHLYIVNKN